MKRILLWLLSAALLLGLGSPAAAATGTFVDDDASVHESDIEALSAASITTGCNPPRNDRYCPEEPVTRGQMAAFLVRAKGYEAGSGNDTFVDDDSSVFEDDIDRLAGAGVARGCSDNSFCPDTLVTRGELAAFLVRAMGYTAGGATNRFGDDDGSVFENDIDRLAAAGITQGCSADAFCPDNPVTRAEMASFLVRALGLDPVDPLPGGTHVTPADVGVTIGAGTSGAVPTTTIGSQAIDVDGTVLEDVVVDGCITVEANHVTIRNVVVNCAAWYPVHAIQTHGLSVTNSTINGMITAKLFVLDSSTDVTITDNDLIGGDDTVFADGDLDGFVFARNYRHDPLGDATSHYDGFQLGEFAPTPGAVTIAYNYFEAIPDGIGVTDLVFATNFSDLDIEVVGNYIGEHGWYTLRAYNTTRLTVKDNVFGAGIDWIALLDSPGPHEFGCNHFESGADVNAADIAGDDFSFQGC